MENTYMVISEEQQKLLNQAIELLKQYDNENVSTYIYYFIVSEDDHSEIGQEYDCCDNEKCVKKTLQELRNGELVNCTYLYEYNNNDYEDIKRCYQCSRPLNDTLAWIKSQLYQHLENNTIKKYLQMSCIAFEVRVMFESMPSCDNDLSEYEKRDPEKIKKAIERQQAFIREVVEYAEVVISVLKEGPDTNSRLRIK